MLIVKVKNFMHTAVHALSTLNNYVHAISTDGSTEPNFGFLQCLIGTCCVLAEKPSPPCVSEET